MFALYAAEQQYRHDTWTRERERALLASIRERTVEVAPRVVRVERPAARTAPAGWARPIGLHDVADSTTACAAA